MSGPKIKSFFWAAGLPALSAFLLTICQAPYDQAWAAWFAWVPFLLACRPPLTLKILLPVVYGIWLVYWLVNLYWLIGVTFPGYLAFCLVQACYGPVLAFAVRFVRRKSWPLTVWAPLIVAGAETWQSVLFTGFSWYFLAHSQYRNLTMIQICDIFGQLGVSVLIAAVNGLAADLLMDAACGRLRRSANLIKSAAVGLLLGLNWFYGAYQLRQSQRFLSDSPLVGAVQTNIPSHIKELSENGPAILQTLLDLSEPCFNAGAWMAAWPETMVLASLNPDYLYYLPPESTARQFDRQIRQFAEDRGYLLVGAHAVRISTSSGEPVAADQYNTAFLYEPNGQQNPSRYDKIHLVPFGEYIPFRQTLPRLYDFIHQLSPYDYDYNLTPGQKYTRFTIEKEGQRYSFSVLICYEDTDSTLCRKMVLDKEGRKADFLVNISNDGWYVRYKDGKVYPTVEQAQRMAITVFRCIENRISILRSVNTGISCLIDPLGQIRNEYLAGTLPTKAVLRQGPDAEGWFVDRVVLDSRITLFTRWGRRLDGVLGIALLGVVLAALADKLYGDEKREPYMKKWLFGVSLLFVWSVLSGCDSSISTVQMPVYQPASAAIQAMVPQARNIVKEGLENPSSYVRTAAIEVAAQTRQEMFLPKIMQLADDPKVTVRFAALVAMGDMQCTSCRQALLKKLEDSNPNVRIAAAYGLSRIGALEYRARILEALKNPNPTVAANAALLVGKMGKREDLPLLWELMTAGNSNEKVLFQTVESMARLQDPKVYRDKIWPLLISKYHDDRIWGIRCMGALGTPDALMAVQTMLQDDVLEVRLAAAEQLGGLGDRSGLSVVQDYFERRPNLDETTVANQLAVSAVGTLRDSSLNGYLSKALTSKSPFIRLMAAKSILLQR